MPMGAPSGPLKHPIPSSAQHTLSGCTSQARPPISAHAWTGWPARQPWRAVGV
ncbi:hypothetical protein B0H19DRAFT_1137074 [Mycena capillaripes]|nr:hypothetical protein B0H19DRAFT_1137074 [Mycena capillaripes]